MQETGAHFRVAVAFAFTPDVADGLATPLARLLVGRRAYTQAARILEMCSR